MRSRILAVYKAHLIVCAIMTMSSFAIFCDIWFKDQFYRSNGNSYLFELVSNYSTFSFIAFPNEMFFWLKQLSISDYSSSLLCLFSSITLSAAVFMFRNKLTGSALIISYFSISIFFAIAMVLL